jgi:Methyltransferase small domain
VQSFRKRLEYEYLKPWVRRLQPWRSIPYGDVLVHYKRHLDGGGSSFGRDYIPFLHDRGMPKQARVFEWCAGPGFIGFALLGFGFCETLCLADVNPQAVRACRRTISGSGLSDRVTVYCSDNLESIPASEQWDLVVGNPGGVVLLQENNSGSTVETFREMIDRSGFSIVSVHGCEPRLTPYTRFYYLGVMRKGEAPPAWLIGG